ncbi:MAG: hypothetical protein MUD02_08035 [Bacteroidales bacterium]|jgi:uncharacterized membrane protein|nr:hypothetical protein [Bacteroidales bacterium]MCU0408882.1 hypothetical protein [Bacteroidales bacterium]
MNAAKFTPAVNKSTLVFLAGAMWCGVGIMLLTLSVKWLEPLPFRPQLLLFGAGALAAIPVHHFGFSRIAGKNLERLMPLTEKRCVFSFITWRSYMIVIVMIAGGVMLRHSPIPKPILAVAYTTIGLALFLSGLKYIRFFIRLLAEGRQTTKSI